ncbi:cytochrome c [Sulfitobacter sp. F26204]|uniref:c-type cytochrome n=1 Tax=Sulfitobacter sp. F26204 TaxID=2996014 RepID=UPI00225E630A|nr:cytochrome c [Sulfitobacter sp. F26204]MCX7560897.1 cytochrome c [Sulfitobacter sp. F26204]
MKPTTVIAATLIAVGLGYVLWSAVWQRSAEQSQPVLEAGALVNVLLPESLSPEAQLGKRGFDAKCAACHGRNAAGRDGVAPPLVHIIYEPGHHGDESFQRAAALGVRAHHWRFGDMPPVTGVTSSDVAKITAYIRALQRTNGIN